MISNFGVESKISELEWFLFLYSSTSCSLFTQLPALALSEAKRNYMGKDLRDTCEFHGIQFKFTSHFPLRSIVPNRVSLVYPDDKLRQVICEFITCCRSATGSLHAGDVSTHPPLDLTLSQPQPRHPNPKPNPGEGRHSHILKLKDYTFWCDPVLRMLCLLTQTVTLNKTWHASHCNRPGNLARWQERRRSWG